MRNSRERSIALLAGNGALAFKALDSALHAHDLTAFAVPLSVGMIGAVTMYIGLALSGEETGTFGAFKVAEVIGFITLAIAGGTLIWPLFCR